MKNLDKRYRTKYGMSMFENLAFIKEMGLEAFLKHEEERWKCPECGATFSVHRTVCVTCGHPRKIMNYSNVKPSV
jgi:ribosomal protein L37E